MVVPTLAVVCPEGLPPAHAILSMAAAARSFYLLDILSQVPDPRKKRAADTR
jgi:hypothetical protein